MTQMKRESKYQKQMRQYIRCPKCAKRARKTGRSVPVIADCANIVSLERRLTEYFCLTCTLWLCHDTYTNLIFIGHLEASAQFLKEILEFEPDVSLEWRDS
ncbi:MAG TPA: hypothetical protein VLX91_05920 [Candidatus Acidoferrales bacterium]|nr:hypothetical protein [Candidatus Acidoferrales bacterium]